jgi:predicted outer membrane protein
MFGTSMTAILLSAGIVVAQAQPAQQAQQQENRQRTGQTQTIERGQDQRGAYHRGGGAIGDEALAQCLAIDNAVEVQLSEYASQRLQNEQAKQFAQQMVRDHRQMLEKLNQFGADQLKLNLGSAARGDVSVRVGQEGQTGTTVQVDRPGERDDARQTDRQPGQTDRQIGQADRQPAGQLARTQGQAGMNPFISIKQEIAQECVRSAQEELATKSGAELDKCFMTAQVFGHQHMLDSLTVMERHASPQLKDTLTQAAQTTRQHLEHAKQILKSLEGTQSNPRAAATSGGTTR